MEERVAEVWEAWLDDPALQEYASILTPEERARAKRFHQSVHARRFIARRVELRRLLAGYLGGDPTQVQLAFGPNGKPFLPGRELELNLSHSFDRALIGFSALPLGIDVERLRPIEEALDLAARFFSPHEAAAVRALPPEGLHQGFFEIWTMKEAYIKATGEGLSRPLDSFSVSVGAERATLTPAREDVHTWSLYRLDVSPGFIGALALQGAAAHRIRYRAR